MKFYRCLFISAMLAGAAMAANALPSQSQWDDDDDIYYNASKAEKKQPKIEKKVKETSPYPAQAASYPDPATYTPVAGAIGIYLDDDTYNRRGQFLVADSVPLDSVDAAERMLEADTYSYTRRIERYHNGDVVNASGNQDLIDSYYSQPTTEVNIYVDNGWGISPWFSSWYSPWYSSWYSPWYSPWYTGWYGPSYAWGWGGWYDPWYGPGWGPSWGWGPSFGPGWGPSWGWGHPGAGPSWGGGNNNWVHNPSGATRPHQPAASASAGSSSVRLPGAVSAGATGFARPGNMGRPTTTSDRYNGTYSPAGATNRPASTGTTINTNRGRNNSSGTTTRQSSQSSRNEHNYTPSRSSSSSSSGSWGSGSHSTRGSGGFGGGSSSGGGGRGRR